MGARKSCSAVRGVACRASILADVSRDCFDGAFEPNGFVAGDPNCGLSGIRSVYHEHPISRDSTPVAVEIPGVSQVSDLNEGESCDPKAVLQGREGATAENTDGRPNRGLSCGLTDPGTAATVAPWARVQGLHRLEQDMRSNDGATSFGGLCVVPRTDGSPCSGGPTP